MKFDPLPDDLYRAHWNSEGPLEPASRTGAYRWDDYRRDARYHVLYTADSPVGALIEKLQKYRGSDTETFELLEAMDENEAPDPIALPPRDTVPESILRETAVSHLRVHDGSAGVVDACDLATIGEMHALAQHHSVMDFNAPGSTVPLPPKPGDLLGSDYSLSQRASVIIFESQRDAAGIVSISSLANPRAPTSYTNYNLFREPPEDGSSLRTSLARRQTALALSGHRAALEEALAYLQARPSRPLDEIGGF